MKMSKPPQRCPVCELEGQEANLTDLAYMVRVQCARCGSFTILRSIGARDRDVIARLSAWLREMNSLGAEIPVLTKPVLEETISALPEYSPGEKQKKLLRAIASLSDFPGCEVSLVPEHDLPLAWSRDKREFEFFANNLLDEGLIKYSDTLTHSGPLYTVVITAAGWAYLEEDSSDTSVRTQVNKMAHDLVAESRADLIIVTVNENETKAVLEVFEAHAGRPASPRTIGDRVYRDLGDVDGLRVFHALSEMGSVGIGATQQTVEKAIRALGPRAVIGVGIAFGTNEREQNIGDILLSKQVLLYELQRVGSDIRVRGDRSHASPRLINYFTGFAQTLWKGERVTPGLVLSGEKLVDDIDYRAQLLDLEPEAVGGEMEGAGLYVACQDKKVDWIILKAICDWGDGEKSKNKQDRQLKAARAVAGFLLQALLHAPLYSKADGNAGRHRRERYSQEPEGPRAHFSSGVDVPAKQPLLQLRSKDVAGKPALSGLVLKNLGEPFRLISTEVVSPGGATAEAIGRGQILENQGISIRLAGIPPELSEPLRLRIQFEDRRGARGVTVFVHDVAGGDYFQESLEE